MPGKFSSIEVATLRSDLLHAELDSFQAAQVIKTFITEHGYGISSDRALDAAVSFDAKGRNMKTFHRELEASALVM
ncbi:MAG TPA: hypothetical protein VG649_10860 [Candidatus Angelobacter sp.]|jgi:hypothetical protein|nr:hypothetical protein [Candidatus Angelobacter sp.]